MRRVALIAACVLWTSAVAAAPSVVSDATTATQVTHCAWYLDSAARELIPAPKDATGKPFCSKDVGTVSNGAHSVAVAFVIQDATWGEQEGPKSDPLAFTRPSVSAKPSTLRLVP